MLITQNIKQSVSVPIFFIIEAYSIFLATLPIIFVPQICNDKLCSPLENYKNMDVLGIIFHFSTVSCFMFAYGIELYREYWCIKNLDVNESFPESRILCSDISSVLKRINKRYVYIWFFTIVMFVVNTFYSSVYLGKYLFRSEDALITFLSYLVSVAHKINSVFTTVNSVLKNTNTISESAYLKKMVIYNIREEN